MGLVLFCIDAKICKKIFVGKLLTRSTRFTCFCTAQTSIFQKCFAYGSYILVPSFPSSLPPGSLLPFGPPGFFCGSGFCAAAPSRPPRSPAPPPTLAVLGTIRSNSRCAGGRSGTRNLSVNSTICIFNTCLAKKNCSSPGTLPFSLQVRQAGCSRSNSCVAIHTRCYFLQIFEGLVLGCIDADFCK